MSADPFAATADPSRQAPVEPGLGVDTAAAEPGFVDLAEPEPTPRESVHSLEARVAAAPDDGLLRRDFGEALVESGQRDRGLAELDAAGRSFEAHEDWPHAASVCDLILRLEPNSIPHHQKRVEYRLGERGQLINAYLELADALFRSGSLDNAKAIYERVLEHDPGNRRAGDALATIAPPEPAGAAPKGEYVDLGELILEDTTDKDTRMRIEQDEPSGNEQQDFQEMLQQFKRGIEENLDEEDSQAHYDLGVAFKEMGLLDEAIGEFQKALRRPDTRLQSAEMLGHCFLEKGQLEVAATVFRRAVEGDPSSDQEKIGLLYWLARCEEDRARPAEALKFYRRVFAVDVNFSDVQQRVNALVQTEG